jgi:flagellar biogenesis protein FliO
MTAKTIAAGPQNFAEASPLAQHLRCAMRWLIRRFTHATDPAERALAVEERVTIGPKRSLILVRCHGQRFLVATAGDTIGPVIELAQSKATRSLRKEHKA